MACMYYLKFTFEGLEYTRDIVFLIILLQIFLNINPYLGRHLRVRFEMGAGKQKNHPRTPRLPRLNVVRIMLET